MVEPDKEQRRTTELRTDDPKFNELTKMRAFDRQQHIQKSLEAGLSREEAERHADLHLEEHDDAHQ